VAPVVGRHERKLRFLLRKVDFHWLRGKQERALRKDEGY
jgi:hypothetical protein